MDQNNLFPLKDSRFETLLGPLTYITALTQFKKMDIKFFTLSLSVGYAKKIALLMFKKVFSCVK